MLSRKATETLQRRIHRKFHAFCATAAGEGVRQAGAISFNNLEERSYFFSGCCLLPGKQTIHTFLCVSLLHPQTGMWLGSTPEIILSGEQGSWSTTALAGTQSLQQGELPINWDSKNKRNSNWSLLTYEDNFKRYTFSPRRKVLCRSCRRACSPENRLPLRSQETNSLGDMLKLLHPTPAVCGLPKEKAYRFILSQEGYDRSYYSGFIGKPESFGQNWIYT